MISFTVFFLPFPVISIFTVLLDLPETLGNALGLLAAFTDVTGSIATRSAKRKTPAIIF